MSFNSENISKSRQSIAASQMDSNALGFWLVNLFNLQDDPAFTDSPAFNVIAQIFGIEEETLRTTIEQLQSKDTTVGEAAQTLYNASTNHSDSALTQADSALGSYYGLNDLPPTYPANFSEAAEVILKIEGGWNPNEPDGAVAKYGINSNANPDLDVFNLTQSKALQRYHEQYWTPIQGIENMDQRTALAVFDLSVNSGVGRANQFLKELEAEGKANLTTGQVDLTAFMQKREDFFDYLVTANPEKYGKYKDGWDNRLATIRHEIEEIEPDQSVSMLAFQNNNNPIDVFAANQDQTTDGAAPIELVVTDTYKPTTSVSVGRSA